MAIITDRFATSAQLVGKLNGLPDYPFAVISHPVADNDDATLRAPSRPRCWTTS